MILCEEIIDTVTTNVFSYKSEDKEVNINNEKAFKLVENKLIEYNIDYCIGSSQYNKKILISGL